MRKKTKRSVTARLGADGKLRRETGKTGCLVQGRVNAALLDSPAAFAPGADTPVLTRRELRELAPVDAGKTPAITDMRRRLGLSQGAFAQLFGTPLATVRDGEQGRRTPDAPARAYLRVIAKNPEAVREALG